MTSAAILSIGVLDMDNGVCPPENANGPEHLVNSRGGLQMSAGQR
jgi:hypothetical protein